MLKSLAAAADRRSCCFRLLSPRAPARPFVHSKFDVGATGDEHRRQIYGVVRANAPQTAWCTCTCSGRWSSGGPLPGRISEFACCAFSPPSLQTAPPLSPLSPLPVALCPPPARLPHASQDPPASSCTGIPLFSPTVKSSAHAGISLARTLGVLAPAVRTLRAPA